MNNKDLVGYESIKNRLAEILKAVDNQEVKIDELIPLLQEANGLTKRAEVLLRNYEEALAASKQE